METRIFTDHDEAISFLNDLRHQRILANLIAEKGPTWRVNYWTLLSEVLP